MTFGGYNVANQSFPNVVDNTETSVTPDFDSTIGVSTATFDSVTLAWAAVTTMTVTDYDVQYKEAASSTWIAWADGISSTTGATITGLTDDTDYEARVRAFDGTNYTCWSNIVSFTTFINNPFFGSENTFLNLSDATTSVVAAYENSAVITLNGGALTTLNQGQTFSFTSATGDIVSSPQKIIVSGLGGGGTKAWASRLSAGRDFLIGSIRNNPQTVYFYAFENATITMIGGGATLDTDTVTAGSSGTLSANFIGNISVQATGLVACYFESSGGADARLMVPRALKVIGFPSTRAHISSGNATGSDIMGATHSNGFVAAYACSSSNFPEVAAQGTTSLYQSEAVIIEGTDTFNAQSFADSNGLASACFLPLELMRQEFIVPTTADYVAFASNQSGTIDVLNAAGSVTSTLTLTNTTSDPDAPFRVRVGTQAAGIRFSASIPVAAWWQEASTDDETLLLGVDS